MEMCYDGALVLPSSYVEVTKEEMMYVEAGWSGSMFVNNLKGAWNSSYNVRAAMKTGGLTWGKIAACASMTAKSIFALYGSAISGAAYIIGGVVLGTIVAGSLIAGINYLGNHRVWY